MSEFHAEAPQATASEGPAQGPYMEARAGFEPTTVRTKGDESTNEPPRPTISVPVVYAIRSLENISSTNGSGPPKSELCVSMSWYFL